MEGKCSAVIVAAGAGTRMGGGVRKQFLQLRDKPVLAHTLEKFQSCGAIDEIILVIPEKEIDYCIKNIVERYNLTKVRKVVPGGAERQESVYKGLAALEEAGIIVIHDGVRPFVGTKDIERTVAAAREGNAAILAVRVKDSIKRESGGLVTAVPRDGLWMAQTPQAFEAGLIIGAHRKAMEEGFIGTDDSVLVERLGVPVKIVEGGYENIKITTGIDLAFAEAILNTEEKGMSNEKG